MIINAYMDAKYILHNQTGFPARPMKNKKYVS